MASKYKIEAVFVDNEYTDNNDNSDSIAGDLASAFLEFNFEVEGEIKVTKIGETT